LKEVTPSFRPLHGFTLVELLAVIAILALLMALLLPAVQSARESARRAVCANHQKQIALALQGYEFSQGRFPPQVGWDDAEGRGTFGSLFFHLLPHLEQRPLLDVAVVTGFSGPSRVVDSISGSGKYVEYAGTIDSRNRVYNQAVDVYQCPTEPASAYTRPAFGWRGSSYASNFQVFGNSPSVPIWSWRNPSNPAHLADWQGRKAPAHVRDGLSQTLALAEKFGTCNALAGGPATGGNMWARWDYLCPWQPTFAADASFQGANSMFQVNPLPYTFPGPCNAAVPQTAHAGGVMNTAFLDGSVRGIDGLIAGSVWWSLCTPRGGELPAGDSL
jgi:prepilin-type N-terminal cleavage/methylation domain-containing protein/prepilin-type processing-associated H-X9-DG protein